MSEAETRPTPPRKQSRVKKLAAWLKLASDVGAIVMDLRDKPSRWDMFSMATRATNLGITWYTERYKPSIAKNVWEYFDEGEGDWRRFPIEYNKMVINGAKDLTVADEYLDADVKFAYACLAKIGNERVGWVVENGQCIEGPYYREDREAETFDALGQLLWQMLGGKHLLYTTSGLVLDAYHDHGVIPTDQMRELLDRTQLFMRAKEPRSYLLAGAPGTGKSVAIRWLATALGLTSVRIDLRLLSSDADSRGSTVAASLQTMLRILKPDVMILDDLDRIEVCAEVLAFLETARQSSRVVMASANRVGALRGAATRPGRIDDIIEFEFLDLNVVQKILGEFADLAELVSELPAAYVAEFARRCRVLGREQALVDLPELIERSVETGQDTNDD